MKKIFTVLVIALTLNAMSAQGQTIPNNGFESLNPDSSLSNWGNVYIIPVWVDTNGNSYTDSIVYDNRYYAPTSDAYSGNTALELRNAWDYTTNTGIAGAVGADDDSVFNAYGLLNLVPTYSTPFNQFMPFNFGFYYKYFPVNGDSAFAQIALWDSSGNQVADGMIIITNAAGSYTLISAPINYTIPGDAAFYSLSISTFYTAVPGSRQPGFGTRLLADDTGFNFVSTTGFNTIDNNKQINIYPNPFADEITINGYSQTGREKQEIKVFDVFGREIYSQQLKTSEVKIQAQSWQSGIYFVRIDNTVLKVVKN